MLRHQIAVRGPILILIALVGLCLGVPGAGTAVAATKYRGWWYYIDGTDRKSKFFFLILQSLISVGLAERVEASQLAPVLTVPVSRWARRWGRSSVARFETLWVTRTVS